jgi:hypothetical protein
MFSFFETEKLRKCVDKYSTNLPKLLQIIRWDVEVCREKKWKEHG